MPGDRPSPVERWRTVLRRKRPPAGPPLGCSLAEGMAWLQGVAALQMTQAHITVARPEGVTVHNQQGVFFRAEWSQVKSYMVVTMPMPPETRLVDLREREVVALDLDHPDAPHYHLMVSPFDIGQWRTVLDERGIPQVEEKP